DLLLYAGCIFAGAGLAIVIERLLVARRGTVVGLALAAVVAIASLWMPGAIERGSQRRTMAAEMAKYTPTDAVLITNLDEPYLEPMVLRNTNRIVLPYDRSGYARLPVAWHKIENPQPPPRNFEDHRCR